MVRKHFISVLGIVCLSCSVVAQQGNVSAGGDATGAGGSMSYSIGQAGFLSYAASPGSVTLGLQQSWLSIPLILEIPNTILGQGESQCFNAVETVIVAGNDRYFILEPGSDAEIIAGKNILLKTGTHAEHGSMFHAYISDAFCGQKEIMITANDQNTGIFNPEPQSALSGMRFRIRPNPTTGEFTLELQNFDESFPLQAEIYSVMGELVMKEELPATKSITFSLLHKSPGMYLILVRNNHEVGVAKIIRK